MLLPAILLSILAAVGISIAGRAVAAVAFSKGVLYESRDITGIFFGTIGLIYSLILAFALVGVWEDYEELRSTVHKEAVKMTRAVHHAAAANATLGQSAAKTMKAYRKSITGKGWNSSEGGAQNECIAILDSLRERITRCAIGAESAALQSLRDDLDDLDDLREERLDHASAHVPILVWVLLIAGSIVVILVSWFFTSASRRLHLILSSALTAMVLLCLLVLYRLDHPLMAYQDALLQEYASVMR